MSALERDAAGMRTLGELMALAESGVESDRDKLKAKAAALDGALPHVQHDRSKYDDG
jgi:hypothetical protein